MKTIMAVLLMLSIWSLYAPAELTRYIIATDRLIEPKFQFEVWFIWVGYIALISMVILIGRRTK